MHYIRVCLGNLQASINDTGKEMPHSLFLYPYKYNAHPNNNNSLYKESVPGKPVSYVLPASSGNMPVMGYVRGRKKVRVDATGE